MYRSYTAHLVLQIESPIIKFVTVEIYYHPSHTIHGHSIKSNSTIKKKTLTHTRKIVKKDQCLFFCSPLSRYYDCER